MNIDQSKLSISLVSLLSGLSFSAGLQAAEFNVAGIEGSFNSQLSIGSSWRIEEPKETLLVSGNNNDGNANFENNDAFSQVFKGTHDLHLRGDYHGVFVRGKYWYDFALEEGEFSHGHSANNFASDEKLNDEGFNELSQFSGAALMDAYIYGMYEIGYTPIDVRIGRQVVSWGESTFILGGVNSINPVDVNAFRRPGAEIKEGLLPVNMAYTNIGLTPSLSLEAFYQLEFQETVIPGCGTYFAFNDYAPEGCDVVLLTSDQTAALSDRQIYGAGLFINRDDEGKREAKDDGQFGLALRYYSEALGDTEFGLYHMNIHSRLPLISGVKATGWENAVAAGGANAAITNNSPSTFYYVSYPEDIQLTGLSFATNVGAVAVSGEVSFKQDVPLQINANQLLTAGLTGFSDSQELNQDVAQTADGTDFKGYRLFDVSQAQFTMVQFFDRILGASRYTLIAEAGYTFVHDLDESNEAIKFGRPGIFGGNGGYVTEDSWGYRLRFAGNYRNVLGATIKPTLAWSHDVEGVAPQPGGAFVEGNQSLGLSVDANFARYYSIGLAYTQYMGGDFNISEDRDFVSVSASAQF